MATISKRERTRLFLAVSAGILALFTGIYFATQAFAPLQFAHLKSTVEMGLAGVHSHQMGGLLAYERNHCEAGKPCTCVALIHGMGDNALTWKRLLMEPASLWIVPLRLYAFDLPGTGGSPRPSDRTEYRARLQGKKIAEILTREAPECERWLVAGNSFGGWVAAWAALEAPAKISRLLLVDAVGLKEQARTGRSLLKEGSVEAMKEFQRKAYFKPRELPESVWRAAAARIQSSNTKDVMAAQTDADYLNTYLGTLRQPTVVLWGEADQITSPTEGKQLAQLIHGAEFRLAKECGHLPQKECPRIVEQTVNDLLRPGAF